jgi:hypothetical protein
MIQSTELMQGNWVDYEDTPYKVIGVGENLIRIELNGLKMTVTETEINPIPLTPEILDKCPQFEMCGINEWICNGFRLILISGKLEFFNHDFPIVIEYLHTLQNLVSLLANTELIVNL